MRLGFSDFSDFTNFESFFIKEISSGLHCLLTVLFCLTWICQNITNSLLIVLFTFKASLGFFIENSPVFGFISTLFLLKWRDSFEVQCSGQVRFPDINFGARLGVPHTFCFWSLKSDSCNKCKIDVIAFTLTEYKLS